MDWRALGLICKDAAANWWEDKVPRLGAALAFYTVLSIAPLLIIVVAIAGMVFGEQAARGEIENQMRSLMGDEGAKAIQTILANAHRPDKDILATVVGVITLLIGAAGVFGQLQDALNTIWEVEPKPGRGIWGFIRDRFLSFAMVLGMGFLLLVSLVISATLAACSKWLTGLAPNFTSLMNVANLGASFLVVTLLFAMIFKVLPDVKIRWRDVWLGAVFTAVLFTFGKYLIGLYLGRSGLGSTYGAAGSLVVLLVWVYYSSQILFFGAELTQAYASRFGPGIVPAEDAKRVTQHDREQQGIPGQKHLEQPEGALPAGVARPGNPNTPARPGSSPPPHPRRVAVRIRRANVVEHVGRSVASLAVAACLSALKPRTSSLAMKRPVPAPRRGGLTWGRWAANVLSLVAVRQLVSAVRREGRRRLERDRVEAARRAARSRMVTSRGKPVHP